jgi:hypothetical protein
VRTKLFSHSGMGRGTDNARSPVHGAVARGDARGQRSEHGGETSPAAPSVGLDEQQARLLAALRRAGGAPVSYAELREVGVELPATVVSELQLAGVPVERCYGGSGDAPGVAGVRLDPARDPARGPVPSRPEDRQRSLPATYPETATAGARRAPVRGGGAPSGRAAPAWTSKVSAVARHTAGDAMRGAAAFGRSLASRAGSSVRGHLTEQRVAAPRERVASGARGRERRPVTAGKRWLAVLALLAAAGAVLALVVAALGGGGEGARFPAAHRDAAKPNSSSPTALANGGGQRSVNRARERPRVHRQPPTPVSAALATQLESRGHGLLDSGRYADAVPVLRRALAATGESLAACVEPTSGTCLTYAYALYDLGRALRLSGQPAAAVPILKRRLEIDNQRPTVAAELELARPGTG